MLLAAGALLALVLASGSFVSVLARLMPPTAVDPRDRSPHPPPRRPAPSLPTATRLRQRATAAAAGTRRLKVTSLVELRARRRGSCVGLPGDIVHARNGPAVPRVQVELVRVRLHARPVWIGIDRTPPQVTALEPARPPDHDGWFNHPVGPQVQGRGRAIGRRVVQLGTTYSGPRALARMVGGTCTDVAGNTGTALTATQLRRDRAGEPAGGGRTRRPAGERSVGRAPTRR